MVHSCDAPTVRLARRSSLDQCLFAVRKSPQCRPLSTGLELGTRESRPVNSVEQISWQHVTDDRRTGSCAALGCWGAEWHDRYPPDGGAYPRQAEARITLQKLPRLKDGSLSARTSAFTLPNVVSGLCLMPS
jgi:hypothetical protein